MKLFFLSSANSFFSTTSLNEENATNAVVWVEREKENDPETAAFIIEWMLKHIRIWNGGLWGKNKRQKHIFSVSHAKLHAKKEKKNTL